MTRLRAMIASKLRHTGTGQHSRLQCRSFRPKGGYMPGYITLYKFTQQGASHIKELPQRIADAKALAEQMGGRNIGVWLTFGEYDLIAVGEGPDDVTVAAFTAILANQGNTTSLTMRAFSEDEIGQIISRLP